MAADRRQKGFTLIELIVVITLIGIMVPAMTLIYSNLLESYRKMRAIQTLTEKFDFTLNKVTDDLNAMKFLLLADDESIRFITTANDTLYYKIDKSADALKLCKSGCATASNFKVMTVGIHDDTSLKYFTGSFSAVNVGSGLNSTSHTTQINSIKYVSFELVLIHDQSSEKSGTVVHPQDKQDL